MTSTRPRNADAQRKAELARIHAQQHQLGMDDEAYRAMLERITGERSAATLGIAGRQAVIAELLRLGASRKRADTQSSQRKKPRALERSAYLRKINALLTDTDKPWEYAHAIAKRMFGVDRIDFVSAANLRKIVAALAIDARRQSAKHSEA
ncbi:MAG: hypothetical protein CVV18_00350 [Gammaproteobacteria bacterium HGW-Gammaproteobacteria-8]|jgi:phage gp16-like protein|nr:MAG: hypothetical protein CVV18_00350 [Gammaproteobacteria bacterium HGW-Gammaproteobacteria-8]